MVGDFSCGLGEGSIELCKESGIFARDFAG